MMTAATYAAAQLLRLLPRTRITRAVGKLCDVALPPRVSEAVVSAYVRAYDVAIDESMTPDGAFTSFDAFFTRRLREGARPECADPEAFVSPSDGKLEDYGSITEDGTLRIKGRHYRTAELIGDEAEAKRLAGGQFAIIYLSPRDYHRVHAPIAGKVVEVRSMPGELYPVNAIGERHIPSLFARNRRVAIVIDTEAHGRVNVVMVGAMIVGRITVSAVEGRDVPLGVHTIDPAMPVRRGDEIGIFHLGSTAVVFTEKGAYPPFDVPLGPVRLGEPLSSEPTP